MTFDGVNWFVVICVLIAIVLQIYLCFLSLSMMLDGVNCFVVIFVEGSDLCTFVLLLNTGRVSRQRLY
jgi:hypothetical protein